MFLAIAAAGFMSCTSPGADDCSDLVYRLKVPPSAEYQRGWCEGFGLAAAASRRNAVHLRALVGPVIGHKNEAAKTAAIMLDGVDRFVVVPAPRLGVTYLTPAGPIICGSAP
jgi:hypothetical protein